MPTQNTKQTGNLVMNDFSELVKSFNTTSFTKETHSEHDEVKESNIAAPNSPIKTIVKKPNKNTQSVNYRKKIFGDFPDNISEHHKDLIMLFRNSYDIRRFTSLAIISQLKKLGVVNNKGTSVNFDFHKYFVLNDGLVKQYYYTDKLFINAIIAAVTLFSNNVKDVVDTFTIVEMNAALVNIVDLNQIDDMVDTVELVVKERKEREL